jgi:hypothetical protein
MSNMIQKKKILTYPRVKLYVVINDFPLEWEQGLDPHGFTDRTLKFSKDNLYFIKGGG